MFDLSPSLRWSLPLLGFLSLTAACASGPSRYDARYAIEAKIKTTTKNKQIDSISIQKGTRRVLIFSREDTSATVTDSDAYWYALVEVDPKLKRGQAVDLSSDQVRVLGVFTVGETYCTSDDARGTITLTSSAAGEMSGALKLKFNTFNCDDIPSLDPMLFFSGPFEAARTRRGEQPWSR